MLNRVHMYIPANEKIRSDMLQSVMYLIYFQVSKINLQSR